MQLDWIIFVLSQLYNQICNTIVLYFRPFSLCLSRLHNKGFAFPRDVYTYILYIRDATFSLLLFIFYFFLFVFVLACAWMMMPSPLAVLPSPTKQEERLSGTKSCFLFAFTALYIPSLHTKSVSLDSVLGGKSFFISPLYYILLDFLTILLYVYTIYIL